MRTKSIGNKQRGQIGKALITLASWLFERIVISLNALMAPTALGVMALVTDERGWVLLVRHSYIEGWLLPGGGVNRGELPDLAIARELKEEIGLTGGRATFTGLFTRHTGWATNVIVLYRVNGATVSFHPSWEVREIIWADPENPPEGVDPYHLRRLTEPQGAAFSRYWQ